MQAKHASPRKTSRRLRASTLVLALLVVGLLAIDVRLGMLILDAQRKGSTAPQTQMSETTASTSSQGALTTTAQTPKETDAAKTEKDSSQPEPKATTPEASATQKKEAEAVRVEPARIEAMMIGDVLMHDELVESGLQADGSYDFGFLFDHIADHIGAADLRILNQETVMGEPERGYYYTLGSLGPIMNTPTALADAEAAYGFNLILKATNHVLDLGYSGLAHELDYWKAHYPTIPVVGVNNPNAAPDDASQDYVNNVYIYEHDGMKVGILNYTWLTNETIDPNNDAHVVSYLSEQKIRADVENARAQGAEMLIACPHWGIQYDTEPSNEELTYARLFCDLGVDVIFGCHPHILQPVVELQNDEGHRTVCFYSMGNFVAAGGMETPTLIGGVARATLQRNEDGTYEVSAASIVPTVCCYTVGPHMSAYPLSEWTYELAAESYRSNLTPDYAHSFCAEVLGQGFDDASCIYTLT